MAQDGEIDLNEVKAKYSVKDIQFVDIREVEFTNEYRLTSEISFMIGFTLLGIVLTKFSWIFFITTFIFLAFGGFSLYRYLKKNKEMQRKETIPSASLSPSITRK